MKVIDGSQGEGGGQILRTALALAAVRGEAVRVENVRANRPKPGLQTQHLVSLRALAHVTQGRLMGDEPGSLTVQYEPGPVLEGEFQFVIPTAGSLTILLQAVMPALAAARRGFTLLLEGGTDVPFAPTWYYARHVHWPTLREMGVVVEDELGAHGYFPAGGGRATVRVDSRAFHPLALPERAGALRVRGVAHGNGLPKHILQRAAEAAHDELLSYGYASQIDVEHHRGPGAGMGISLWTEGGALRFGADAVGRRGKPAELVGREAAASLAADLAAGCQVDAHQADMLPPFLALTGGGAYTVRGVTGHLETTLRIVEAMTGAPCRVEDAPKGLRRIVVGTPR